MKLFPALFLLLLLSVVNFGHLAAQDKSNTDSKKSNQRPIKALLITGGCCHDYDKQKLILTEGISARTNIKIEWTIVQQGGKTTDTKIPIYEKKDWAKGYDIVIHNECFANIVDADWIERVLKPHREGVNAMVIHCAMHTFSKFKGNAYRDFLGVTSRRHGPHHAFKVENLATNDPIMKGFGESWQTPKGELYYVDSIGARTTPLARAFSSGGRKKQEICVWKNTYGKARVFGTTMGHHNETMSSPKYLDMVTRGLLWAVGRLDEKHVVRPPVKKVPLNLAFRKPATASANQNGHLPRAATDGSLETRYCADNNEPGDWFKVDLGKSQKVTGVQVHWEHAGRLYRFKLEGSNNDKDWSLLFDGSQNKSREQVQKFEFKPADWRYLRMTCTETESGAWFSFWEFAVHGTQVVEVEVDPAYKKKLPLNDPVALIKEMKIPEGFEAKIFAAPPQVNYPVCLTSTYNGDVYVGVDKNGSLDRKEGRGSVIRCRDTDQDGKADEFKTFCEVDSPRGLVWDRNRLFVLHPPDLSVYYDEDGDGKADRKETLVKGIGFGLDFRGADHTTNGIRMGIDGWIYVAVGDYGFIKATAKDGKSLQFKGGGVVRVRPDGTDLEVYARGLRNICDVAIDPLMNMFTRDNTNDGGGWDIRLSHIIQSANYGYPSWYKNFNEEIMPPLADYGGGSGTGALFVSNELLPEKFRHALFTCDWGRNKVFFHPLKPEGATFSAKQEDFLNIPRPTDMDLDANGNIYVASWRRGQFKYQGENIGFVTVLSPKNGKGSDESRIRFEKLTDDELVSKLQSNNDSIRWETVREIKHRNCGEKIKPKLDQIINSKVSIESKVAALAAGSAELASAHLQNAIKKNDWELTRHLIRFATDQGSVQNDTLGLLVECLKADSARVQIAALIALGRIGDPTTSDSVVQFASTIEIDRSKDKGVKTPINTSAKAMKHVAVQTLSKLGNVSNLHQHARKTSAASEVAFGALKYIHSKENVDGLASMIQGDSANERVWQTLIRLYHVEGPYTGDWWGTRPDTTGPYYKRATWEQSTRIAGLIEGQFSQLDGATQKFVVSQLEKHRVKLPGIVAMKGNSKSEANKTVEVKIPKFDKNNPHQLGNIDYDEIVVQIQGIKGKPKLGKRLYKEQSCAACHSVEPGAKAIGPQLVDIGQRYRRNELLESILKPTAKIAQGFTTQIIATEDGLTHTGFVTREAGDEVELRNSEGKSIVLKKDTIEARKDSKNSVMPEGLVNNLTVEELASLIAYLQTLKSKTPAKK